MLTRPRAGGGTIIDGSGAPRFAGDVAVDGDKITAVGAVPGTGKKEIDATGKIVQPGWVDIHTHCESTPRLARHRMRGLNPADASWPQQDINSTIAACLQTMASAPGTRG